ncbi:hypothetical protein A5893_01820 [Pedobacter psychrophilus]|uniref:SdiA-regulated family protein n=1 Tax=Pedobacter psychrophilus TaxID=1826909 RepID=A0A179DMD2_9SPHI|nr:SdiA-regulated domain-containing protein [Pedobacter psychrophilus]OAQ41880.1 hypothetical protein A5893_01820 [Pedobacter psychrophilus]
MYKLFFLVSFLFLTACIDPSKIFNDEEKKEGIFSIDYDVIELPEDLKEISGFTFITDSIIAAIEDENGLIYYFDLNKNKIIKTYKFADKGDYEDIVRVDNDLYVVESKGDIYQIIDFNNKPLVTKFKTPLQSKNNIEGINYDSNSNNILLSVKDKNFDKDDKKNEQKNIYSFSLKDKIFHKTPAYQIKLKNIQNHFKGDKLTEISKRFLRAVGNENQNEILKPTAITFKPGTKDLYVLSSINNIIIVMASADSIKQIIPFHGNAFNQPEGMAFNSKGELYISNEGGKNPGNIIKIKKLDAK